MPDYEDDLLGRYTSHGRAVAGEWSRGISDTARRALTVLELHALEDAIGFAKQITEKGFQDA